MFCPTGNEYRPRVNGVMTLQFSAPITGQLRFFMERPAPFSKYEVSGDKVYGSPNESGLFLLSLPPLEWAKIYSRFSRSRQLGGLVPVHRLGVPLKCKAK